MGKYGGITQNIGDFPVPRLITPEAMVCKWILSQNQFANGKPTNMFTGKVTQVFLPTNILVEIIPNSDKANSDCPSK